MTNLKRLSFFFSSPRHTHKRHYSIHPDLIRIKCAQNIIYCLRHLPHLYLDCILLIQNIGTENTVKTTKLRKKFYTWRARPAQLLAFVYVGVQPSVPKLNVYIILLFDLTLVWECKI